MPTPKSWTTRLMSWMCGARQWIEPRRTSGPGKDPAGLGDAARVAAGDLEAPEPHPLPLHGEQRVAVPGSQVNGGPLARQLADGDGRVGGALETAGELAAVGPAAQPEGVARFDR